MLASAIALTSLVCIGCDGSLAPSKPSVPPASATLCGAAGWTSLSQLGVHESGPASLATANGNLYFPIDDPPSIVSVPLAGGAPTVVATVPESIGYPSRVWIVNDAIDFAIPDDKLWQVPFAGGTPALVADGMTAYLPPSYAVPSTMALAGGDLYFDLRPEDGNPFWNIWRMPTAGGAAEKLADLPLPTPPVNWPAMATNADNVIVAFEDNPDVGAYAVPLGGGPPAVLPGPPTVGVAGFEELLGVGPQGILWYTFDANGVSLSLTDLRDPSAPVLRPFWSELPSSFDPIAIEAWPDVADGSWLITVWEPFDDGQTHTSLWSVDTGGNAVRLGCDPTPGSGIITSVFATTSSVYAMLGESTSGPFTYSVVRIDR